MNLVFRGQKAEGRRQRAEGRSQRAEGRSQRVEGSIKCVVTFGGTARVQNDKDNHAE